MTAAEGVDGDQAENQNPYKDSNRTQGLNTLELSSAGQSFTLHGSVSSVGVLFCFVFLT